MAETNKEFIQNLAAHLLRNTNEDLKTSHMLSGITGFVNNLTEQEADYIITLCFTAHNARMASIVEDALLQVLPPEGDIQ